MAKPSRIAVLVAVGLFVVLPVVSAAASVARRRVRRSSPRTSSWLHRCCPSWYRWIARYLPRTCRMWRSYGAGGDVHLAPVAPVGLADPDGRPADGDAGPEKVERRSASAGEAEGKTTAAAVAADNEEAYQVGHRAGASRPGDRVGTGARVGLAVGGADSDGVARVTGAARVPRRRCHRRWRRPPPGCRC